ncbi:MAG: response regulator transcription factor [Rhodocyclaceae bacterium]|jgi:two-component system invasion response regulator UvrY|nr:MAG: response regulator transcription factor [Rhodocyclaceae bacterium]
MLSVAIVDDHQIVRAGFRDMLEDELGVELAFEAGSGEAALEMVCSKACNVMLLDLSLPGKSGVDTLREMRQRHPDVRVLVLSGFPEERYALSMLRNGADGYLCKDCEREELIKAIRTVASGRRYVSPRTAQLLADEMTGASHGAPHDTLSERELQVFLRLAGGASVTDIADGLHLSVKTISTYRTRLLEKLGVSSNAELAAYAIRHGLIVE